MNRHSTLAGAVMLLAAGTAQADVLASTPAYGGPSQKVAACYIFNMGTTNLVISSIAAIREPNGVSPPLITSNCPSLLPPGGICRAVYTLTNYDIVVCKVTLPSKTNARASLEIRNVSNYPLNSRDLK